MIYIINIILQIKKNNNQKKYIFYKEDNISFH